MNDWQKSLDNYITGGRRHLDTSEFQCSNGHIWIVEGYTEYGFFELINEDNCFCPICGKMDKEYEL